MSAWIVEPITWLIAAATLPGSLLLALLSAAALRPGARRTLAEPAPSKSRLAFVVPAHNEAAHIETTVSCLVAACAADGNAEVWVIADNCSDDTAERARHAGAKVLERNNPDRRGKGFALEYAFTRLPPEAGEWLIVIDADSTLNPGFLPAMRTALQPDRNAVQACYLSHAGKHLRSRVSRIGQWGFNLVRPLGRQRLGLSCGLFGNGFALRRSLLDVLPYTAHSVVEDLEYHLLLVAAGERVHFVAEAVVMGEIADTADGARTQRSRWEGGRLRMLKEHCFPLLGRCLRLERGAMEVLADLLLLPLGLHVLLLIVAAALGGVGLWAAGFGTVAIGLYLGAILRLGPTTPRDLGALALSPIYLVWKLSLLPATLLHSRPQAAWVRSRRNNRDNSQ